MREDAGARGEAGDMPITSKKQTRSKFPHLAGRIKATAVRVDDLLGDFSEQTGALFG
jgi:hypothetical protein